MIIFFSILNPVHVQGCHKEAEDGVFPSYYKCGPQLLSKENRRKIEPKEIPSCLMPRLLVVFTRQLEILTDIPGTYVQS